MTPLEKVQGALKYLDPDFYVEAIARKVHGDLGKEKPFKWHALNAALMVSF